MFRTRFHEFWVCWICSTVTLVSFLFLDHRQVVVAQTNLASQVDGSQAFEAMIPVLRHPRCMNCHSRGDYPREGDDRHQHTMNVRRGPTGNGAAGVKCSTCHHTVNATGLHSPPGAPGWHLPSSDNPLVWEGLTDRELCELFKDPTKNGERNLDQIVEHMRTPLVLWGWNPGEGRTPIPVPENVFLANAQRWAADGGKCPAK
jgi:hypothetical protein